MKLLHSKFSTLILLLISQLVYTGCKKELISDGETVPFGYLYTTSFYEDNAPKPQSYSFSTSKSNSFIGPKGTRVSIPQNAFVDANGNAVNGQFDFFMTEIFTVEDMIFSDKMTVSNGQLLSSGGELYVNAQQNGQRLELAPGKSISIEVPTNNPTPQMAFFGGVGSGSNFNWVPDTSTTVNITTDTASQQTYYNFYCDTLWTFMNCDYYFSDPRPKTDVEIQVPTGYDNTNTQVYIYVPVDNIMVRVYTYSNGSFYIQNGYQLPVGLNVYFIGMRPKSNALEYALQQATIVNNHVEVLSFSTITLAQLKVLLASL